MLRHCKLAGGLQAAAVLAIICEVCVAWRRLSETPAHAARLVLRHGEPRRLYAERLFGRVDRTGEGSDVQNSELAVKTEFHWKDVLPRILNSVRLSLTF